MDDMGMMMKPNIELLYTSNGGNRKKLYPGDFTKREIDLISKWVKGRSLHIFSGKSNIGDVRVDYSMTEATINMDVFEYLEMAIKKKIWFKTIILDPPYNARFAKKYQALGETAKQFIVFANARKTTVLFNLLRELAPTYIIMKSWNIYPFKEMEISEIRLCYAGGYRKPTILQLTTRI